MSNLENLTYKTLKSMKESIAGALFVAVFLFLVGLFFFFLKAEEIAGMAFGYSIFMFLVTGWFYISYRSRSKKSDKVFQNE